MGNICSFFFLPLAILCLDPHSSRRNTAEVLEWQTVMEKANRNISAVVLTTGNWYTKSHIQKEKSWGKLSERICKSSGLNN